MRKLRPRQRPAQPASHQQMSESEESRVFDSSPTPRCTALPVCSAAAYGRVLGVQFGLRPPAPRESKAHAAEVEPARRRPQPPLTESRADRAAGGTRREDTACRSSVSSRNRDHGAWSTRGQWVFVSVSERREVRADVNHRFVCPTNVNDYSAGSPAETLF